MVYASVGIPLCLSVLADIGQILATIISKMIEQYKMFVVPILKKYNMIAQKKKYVTRLLGILFEISSVEKLYECHETDCSWI